MISHSIAIETYQYQWQCQLFQQGIINCQCQYQYLKNVNTNGSSILLLMSETALCTSTLQKSFAKVTQSAN